MPKSAIQGTSSKKRKQRERGDPGAAVAATKATRRKSFTQRRKDANESGMAPVPFFSCLSCVLWTKDRKIKDRKIGGSADLGEDGSFKAEGQKDDGQKNEPAGPAPKPNELRATDRHR
jgi:hypothetical protein